MDERSPIQSRVYYDLDLHKEYARLTSQANLLSTVLWCVNLLGILYLFSGFDRPFTVKTFLLLALYFLIVRLYLYFKHRNGGAVYKRILYQNNGNVPLQTILFEESTIRTRNEITSCDLLTSYDGVRFLAESKNLLLLVTDLKMVQIVNKNTLSGGSRDDLISLLRQKCPKLQKRIRTGLLARIINVLLCVLLVIGVIWGSAVLLKIPEKLSGQLTNDLTYQEIAAELESVGIIISDRTIQEMEEYDRDYAEEYGDYYRINSDASKVYDLLYWEGCGVYDDQTWDWTPSTSGIYWFDMEVINVGTIYRDFLRGIEAMDETLCFTAVSEDYSNVDLENGSGTVRFSFAHDGQVHHFTATFMDDWFDMNILYDVGAVLAADQHYEDLWHAFDDGQGILLYYGTKEHAENLSDLTGLDFHACVKSPIAK